MGFPGGTYKGDYVLYDTIQLPAAAGIFPFFQVPIGGAIGAAAKTLQHTNMRLAGMLPLDQTMQVMGFGLSVREIAVGGARPTFVDVQQINLSWIQLWVEDHSMLTLQLDELPNSAGTLQYFSNIAAAATEFKMLKGVPAYGNMFQLREPITLEPQKTFRVDFNLVAVLGAVTDVSFKMYGLLTRAVV